MAARKQKRSEDRAMSQVKHRFDNAYEALYMLQGALEAALLPAHSESLASAHKKALAAVDKMLAAADLTKKDIGR